MLLERNWSNSDNTKINFEVVVMLKKNIYPSFHFSLASTPVKIVQGKSIFVASVCHMLLKYGL